MGIFFTWHSSEHIFQLDVKWKARDWIWVQLTRELGCPLLSISTQNTHSQTIMGNFRNYSPKTPFAPTPCSRVKQGPTCTKVAYVDVAADPSLV